MVRFIGLTAAAGARPGWGVPATTTRRHRMTPTADVNDRPTGKQLAYLKALAARSGQSFAWPQTRAQASREIRRLRSLPAAHDLPNDFDLDIERAAREANADVPIQAFEVAGFGSATWSQRS
jgi:hypothetical protein